MSLPKSVCILLWSGGGLVAALGLLFLLRWPLFGGIVRSKMAELVSKELRAELAVEDLGGSLLWSIHARNAVLQPGPDAPFRAAQVDRIDVHYGFLGSGEPSIRVEGARFVLAPKDGPAPPIHETVRQVVSVLRSLRFPGSVLASNVEAVLPDGRTVKLDRGSLDHGTWSVTLQTAGFGAIDGTAVLRPDGALTFEGKASEGPVRSARLELGAGDQCPLRVTTEVEGHALTWVGTASFTKGQLDRVDGELQVKQGRAQTRADFLTGRVEADIDAVLAIDKEFKGDLAITARAAGPLSGQPEAWTLQEGRVRTKNARFRDLAIDEADIALGAGSLAKVSVQATARSGRDQIRAEGVFGWDGKPDVEARIDASAADAKPYLALLNKPIPILRCQDVRAEGTLRIHEDAVSYDGSASMGAGEYHGLAWDKAEFKGALGTDRIVAREIAVKGSKFAKSIVASGKLEGETLSLQFRSDLDQGKLEGRFHRETGDFEGHLELEGPMTWLELGFGLKLPANIVPIRAEGKVKHEKEDTVVAFDVGGKSGFSVALAATMRQKGEDWIVAVSPGALTLPERKISFDAFVFSLTHGKASLDNLKIACTEPELSAKISGSASWDEKEKKIIFRMQETTVHGAPIDPLFARVTIDTATEDAVVNLRWGKDDGDHLHVEGRWGKEVDLTANLRAGDLKRPLVRHFLPSVELEGSIAADARVTGTREDPRVTGNITLTKISTAGLPPLSLVLGLESQKKMLLIMSSAERTPYGKLTIEGAVPLPGSKEPLDLSLGLDTDNLSPFLDRLSRQARAWIPPGGLSAVVSLRGSMAKPELVGRANFSSLRWKPPQPLGEARDIRIQARLDADGIAFESVDGLLGEGPFWASGRWDAFRPGYPLSLWITGRDALAVDDPLARLRVKPDVVLSWTEGSAVKLSGRVEIPLAIYHREFSAATPGARVVARQVNAPRLRLIPGESGGFLIPGIEGLEGLELDLQFVTTGEFRIENGAVGVLLRGEGQMSGTAAEPALSGVFRSLPRRGEVKLAPGNFLRIVSAEAVLPEELGRSPTIRFEGSVGAGEGTITVLVEGPLENPSLMLKSDPPQPQKDLLSQLAFGLEMGSHTSETGVATLALYIYSQAKDDWPSADRKEGFFDRFRPQVVANDPTRRKPWELPPQGTTRSTAIRTEYVLNSTFSIVAETNREGDIAGDLKLRIRF